MSVAPSRPLDSLLSISQLPIELVHEILLGVAHLSIHVNRTWVVHIALVCRDIYRLVKDVLYHTMVVTSANVNRLRSMSEDPIYLHVFRSVRCLFIISDSITFDAPNNLVSTEGPWNSVRFTELFASAIEFDVPFHVLEVLAKHPAFRPTRLTVRYRPYIHIASSSFLRSRSLSRVTHLEGYLPHSFETESPRQWVLTLMSAVPALTHIAFDIIDLQPASADWELHVRYPPLNESFLEEVIRTALEQPQIQVVALDVAGERVAESSLVMRILHRINDHRVRFWLDTRMLLTWTDEEDVSAEDAWAGRDVWSESKHL